MAAWCPWGEHIFVQVVGGKTYDPDFDTQVCVRCEYHIAARKDD